MTRIVTVNVNTQVAAAPSNFQRKGAIISCGGTNLAPGTSSLLTQAADLTPLLAAAVVITTLVWASSVVTVTTATPHNYTSGDVVTISGAVPTGYNVTAVATVTGASTFTYPLVSTPGSMTTPGVVTDADVAELTAQVGTFYANGSAPVYVLELGSGGGATAEVALMATYLTANPLAFYAYLVPREWAAEATYVTLCKLFDSDTSKTYFHTTVTLSTYAAFANVKSAPIMIEAPSIPATEFSAASRFFAVINEDPSPTNQVAPFSYRFLFGVTAYPVTVPQQATFKAANLDYVTTGAEGGISNTILALGVCPDGNPINYWYSVDSMQINIDLNIANEIINGSNNPQAPLYFDQQGINRLNNRATNTAAGQVANGLAVGPVTQFNLTAAQFSALLASGKAPLGVLNNAVPFASYVSLNPGDYPIGRYTGLSISYTPARGFTNVVFNINVSNFVA